jgi:hypothetical protein
VTTPVPPLRPLGSACGWLAPATCSMPCNLISLRRWLSSRACADIDIDIVLSLLPALAKPDVSPCWADVSHRASLHGPCLLENAPETAGCVCSRPSNGACSGNLRVEICKAAKAVAAVWVGNEGSGTGQTFGAAGGRAAEWNSRLQALRSSRALPKWNKVGGWEEAGNEAIEGKRGSCHRQRNRSNRLLQAPRENTR